MLTKKMNARGFTLIELMIGLVIVTILASMATASYQLVVRNANRMDARAGLHEAAQRLQRCHSLFGRYDSDDCVVRLKLTAEGGQMSSAGHYAISLTAVDRETFVLTAQARSNLQVADRACTYFTLSHSGATAPAQCW